MAITHDGCMPIARPLRGGELAGRTVAATPTIAHLKAIIRDHVQVSKRPITGDIHHHEKRSGRSSMPILMLWPLIGAAALPEEQRELATDAVRVLYDGGRQAMAERIAAISPALFRELEAATGLAIDFRPTVILCIHPV